MATILPLADRRSENETLAGRESVRLSLTRRGRRLVVVVAFLLGLLVASLALLVLDLPSAVAGDRSEPVVVTVEAGDTLWKYAERYAPSEDPQDFVREMRRINTLPTGRLVEGQSVTLPAVVAGD